MGNLFFSPNGRIAKHRFWQGLVILTVASVLASAGVWLVTDMFALLTYAIIFPYICVYGKRLHDSGRSAWWVIAIWGGSIVFQTILLVIFIVAILPSLMSPEQKQTLEEILKLAEAGDNAEAMKGVEFLKEDMKDVFQRALLVLIVMANAVMGYIVGSLATEPRKNQYGPIPGSMTGGTFD